jgi:HEAT repeat protein
MSRRVGILTTDTALVVTSWDATLAAMTGIDAAHARGRSITAIVPDLEARGLIGVVREPLVSGAPQVLAPALHHYLIPCPPAAPSADFDHMQQRVVIGALRDDERTAGLVITIEDVTVRMERERRLARQLADADPAERLRAIEQLSATEPVDGAGPLASAIGDDDWQVRRVAVRALAGRSDQTLVEALVAALRDNHRNFSVLSSALQLLTLTGVDLTASLVGLLADPDSDLRLHAALALGTQSSAAAVEALLGALDDPDPNVRFHAIESLAKLSPPAAVERLAAIAEGGDFFLAFPALDALARINDPAVVPRILPLLTDEMLGAQAADALAQIGDEDAVVALVNALDRDASLVPNVVDALAAIARRYEEQFAAGAHIEDLVRRSMTPAAAQRMIDTVAGLSGAQLRNLVIVLGWLRGAAVERALTRLLGTAEVHHESVEAIVRFGSPMVERLIEQLGQEDLDARRAAVVALGRIGDRRAVPPLISLLDGDRELIVPVAGALARIGDAQAFRPLLTLLGDHDVSVRHAVIGALNSIGHPEMPDAINRLLDSADRNVRESAVKIAGYFGFVECANGLLARCTDEDEVVRAAALEHVGYLEDGRVLPLLIRALAADTPRGRASAAQALAHVDAPEARLALEAATADPDLWVRYFATISIGRVGGAAAIPVLTPLATADPVQHVRIAAIEAIGRIGGSAAVGLLTPFVDDSDAAVAGAAAHALGGIDAESVGEPLRRVMASADPARRAAAVDALVRWGRCGAIDALRWAVTSDGDPAVVRAATCGLAALAGHPGEVAAQAVTALVELAVDSARGTDAAQGLAQIPAGAIPLLGGCLNSRNAAVRRAVVDAMGRLSHATSSAYLRTALDDTDADVRQKAIVGLSRVGARGLARKFARMAREDDAASVRHTATSALRRYGSRDADVAEV